jgi:hypothetical protein
MVCTPLSMNLVFSSRVQFDLPQDLTYDKFGKLNASDSAAMYKGISLELYTIIMYIDP